MLPPLEGDEIRILSILPAPSGLDQTAQIECDIRVAPLSNLPSYEALSYVWGSETASTPIIVTGHPIVVSQSLHSALCRLRLPDHERLVWVDQLCIDQRNIQEKTRQVQLMSGIYTKRCIIWMGEIKDGVPLADAYAAVQILQYMAARRGAKDPNSVPIPAAFPSRFEAAINALRGISNFDQWWNRIWTVQEAVLPKDTILQWGPFDIRWSIVQQAREAWLGGGALRPLNYPDVRSSAGHTVLTDLMVHVGWLMSTKSHRGGPLPMIHRFRFRRATDPRDKIYGLLVFNTLTKELIVDENGLRPLTNSPRQHPSEATPGVPSWALDLASSLPKYAPERFYLLHGYTEYRASESLGPIDIGGIRAQVGLDTLTLTGVLIDTIVRVQDGYKTKEFGPLNFPATEALLHEWYAIALGSTFNSSQQPSVSISNDTYPRNAYTRSEAFAKVALGDVIRGVNQVPARRANNNDIQDIWKLMRGQGGAVKHETRRTVYGMMNNHNLFVTEIGLMGSGHVDTQIGDEVWVFKGGNVPFVVRPRIGKGEHGYSFVGQCFVQGIMRGEIASWEGLVEKDVCLY
ncbi:hypothetical protein N0V90_002061 [Kalmusia sp. IMI 367209]|nr:hypothetical protein N0V90_002061 [Kalmusia sp. IMI 367209]